MKRADVWIVLVVLVIGSAIMIPYLFMNDDSASGEQLYARITVNGELYQTLELTGELQELRIESEYGYNVVRAYDGGIQMIEASCPDQLCLLYGFVNRVGQAIICLPNRVVVEVISGDGIPAEVDGVAS